MKRIILATLLVFLMGCKTLMAGLDPDFRKGVNLVDDEKNPYGSFLSFKDVRDLYDHGINWINITPVAMMFDYKSNRIDSTSRRHASKQKYIAMINYAHSLGIKVSIKPLLFLKNADGHWHGTIEPSNIDRWFASFANHVRYYLKIAEETGVEEFTIGSEFISMMTGYPEENTFGYVWKWIDLITMARSIYSGEIAYDFNFGVEFPTFYRRVMEGNELFTRLYNELDSLGYDSYESLGRREDQVSPEQLPEYLKEEAHKLSDNLAKMMSDMAEKTGVKHRLVVKEIGYKSTPGSYIDPWMYDDPNLPVDVPTQMHAYRAIMEAYMSNEWIHGIFWWDYPTDPNRSGNSDSGYTPKGKNTMNVIKEFWQD